MMLQKGYQKMQGAGSWGTKISFLDKKGEDDIWTAEVLLTLN